MQEPRGRSVRLSAHRIMIGDLMHFARKLPSVPVQRRMRLGEVVAARNGARPRPSWPAIFTKAFALVAADMPELRRTYLALPWARLYEHSISIASVAVEKPLGPATAAGQERAIFFARLRRPDKHRLLALDRHLKRFAHSPGANSSLAALGLWVSLLPRSLRRLLWWYSLNAEGYFRSRHYGTYGLSVYSALGAESLHPLSPLTCVLNYGLIDERGDVDVRIVYDHRVLDGANVARALAALEAALGGPILAELRRLWPAPSSPVA